MDRLWELVAREGIYVKWADLASAPEGLRGMYYYDPVCRRPVIVLDRRLAARPRELRCVLAEELGHHFTVPQADALRPRFAFADAVARGRDEARALRWAGRLLVPEAQLRSALARGEDLAELAERFDVTEGFLRRLLADRSRRAPRRARPGAAPRAARPGARPSRAAGR